MINERGGINGRKIRFISRDDSSNPRTAVEHTSELVEQERVHLMFGSFGTPSNLATRTYLNERNIPQLFVASGDEEWAHPKRFPWTMGWQPTFRAEGRIYANYIQSSYPSRKIAVLWQNDQFGRDLFRGLQEGLGITANMIVADIAIDADMSIDTQVDILKNSGAEVLVLNCAPPISARAIRRAAELGWHPQLLLVNAAASIANALRPAGLQNSVGVISTSFLKDASDTTWKEDPAIKEWLAFMDKYYPDGDKDDGYAIFGYAAAETLVQVLTQCGDDLSRENIMRQAASLRNYQSPNRVAGNCDQHRAGRLPPDQADAAGAVRRQRLAADRRRDRERVRERGRTINECGLDSSVMAGLDPAIHVLSREAQGEARRACLGVHAHAYAKYVRA